MFKIKIDELPLIRKPGSPADILCKFYELGFRSPMPASRTDDGRKRPHVKWTEERLLEGAVARDHMRSVTLHMIANGLAMNIIPEGVVIIDIDQHGDDNGFAFLNETFGPVISEQLFNTLSVTTPRKGRHLYFRTLTKFKKSALVSAGRKCGIDVLPAGNVSVIPGTCSYELLPDPDYISELPIFFEQFIIRCENAQKKEVKYYRPRGIDTGTNGEANLERAKKVPIENILTSYGVDYSKPFLCISPDHSDNNPSMSVNKPANKVKCFSCGVSLDGVDIVQILGNCSFKEAIKALNTI